MVNNFLLFFIISFLLTGCSQPLNKLNEEITKSEMNNMTNDEKEAYDKQYLEDLRDIGLSEKDFLYISKYIIELAEKNDFPEVDPILGIKEFMSTKDFTYPYAFYHYRDIPAYPELEIVLKIEKNNNKLKSISFTPGVPINFILRNSNINILDALKLKLEKKELFYYSNQLARYQLSDGTFKYEVVAKNTHMENTLPKDFYSFTINIE